MARPTANRVRKMVPEAFSARRKRLLTPFGVCAMLAAIVCAALALFICTEDWVNWFEHPALQAMPEIARRGAGLWRIMLGVCAAALVIAPMLIQRIVVIEDDEGNRSPIGSVLSRNRLGGWGLMGLIVVAFVFRAARSNESLWYDEIASWMTYNGGVKSAWGGAIMGSFLDPINHVFHTLLNSWSVRFLTPALGLELAFRLPALLFSLLSVLMMYELGKAAGGERIGFLAAGLAAVLPVSVLEGCEARGYSMMIFFSALMTWLLMTARSRKRPWLWGLYAISCALGIWSHFVTAYVPIGHAVWLGWRAVRHKEWRNAATGFASLALGAMLTITLYSPMAPGMLHARGVFAANTPNQPRIFSAEGFHALLQLGGSWYWWAAIPGLILGLIGLIAVFQGRETASGGRSVVALSLLGLPLMLLSVMISGSWVYARFTFFALPGAMMLIALGLDWYWRSRPIGFFFGVGLLIACSIVDLRIRPPKQPLRDAAEYVELHHREGDRTLVVGLAHEVSRMYAHDESMRYSLRFGADLEKKLESLQPHWVIVEYPKHVAAEKYELLQRNGFSEVQRFEGWADWVHGDVLVFRRP